MAAVNQRLARIQAGHFKVALKNIAAGRQHQRMGPHLLPNHPFIHQIGNTRRGRLLMVFHGQVISLALDKRIDELAHRRQPCRVGQMMHHGIAKRIQLLFHFGG